MAKKGGHRIKVRLDCMTCKRANYVTSVNKLNREGKLTGIEKFCSLCRTRTPHKEVEKMK